MEDKKYSFEELYNKLYSHHFEELEKLRKESRSKISKYFLWLGMILFGSGAAGVCSEIGISEESYIYWVLFGVIVVGFLGIIILFGIGVTNWTKQHNVLDDNGKINNANYRNSVNNAKKYKYAFKEKIIKPIIECAIAGSTYIPEKGLSEQEYYKVWEKADGFYAEDEIIAELDVKDNEGNKLQLIMSEVLTQKEELYNGQRSYSTVFNGLAGYIKLPKNVGTYIKILRNDILFNKSEENVQMDMSEFEKIFDVETNDRITTVQLLTSDIITELVNVIKEMNIEFEIYINYNILHIRFCTGEFFEPQIFGESIQLDKLKKYYDVIKTVKRVTEMMCNAINELEI